jgi:circadian clock protein KaiC
MTDAATLPPPLPRIVTGVPGLDAVTGGGFLQSGVYILQGSPGAGKTILANQIVHRHAAGGGNVVYVTMLAESHGRLLQHMEGFAFFDPSALPDRIYYVSAFNALRKDGLKGVVELLRSEMRSRRAGIVVLDGLVMAASAAQSDEELKLFVSDIQAHSTLTGCTTLLLTSEDADRPVSAEQTMVDGILLLRESAYGRRRERNIEVVKFRGSSTLRGNHAFSIDGKGITIFPRMEAGPLQEPPGDAVQPVAVRTGVAALDAMFEIGGYGQGSVTAISGPSGSGKTCLTLHFLAQASASAKAVFLGFYESPQLLQRIAGLLGLHGGQPLDMANISFLWRPFGENMLDALARDLLEEVRRTQAKRVVIDGVGGFMAAPTFSERGGPFIAALMNELRRLGATTLVTIEENDTSGTRPIETPALSAFADNLLQLKVHSDGAIQRFLGIRKSRVSRYDPRVRELVLTPTGIDIAAAQPAAGA